MNFARCIAGAHPLFLTNLLFYVTTYEIEITLQLLAVDVSAQVTMKDAAKCDKRCEWQNSANQENVERILHFQVTPESTSGSGPLALHVHKMNEKCLRYSCFGTFLSASDVVEKQTVGVRKITTNVAIPVRR